MRQRVLLGYQWVTGLSDTGTGILLYFAPLFTLHLMGVHAPTGAAPYVSYIGTFVLSVGIACLYGVRIIALGASSEKLEMVWLLTTFSRSAVAIYIVKCIFAGELELAWISVALFDGVIAAIQGIGLRKRWLSHAF